ncbi:MAG: glycerophosphodiester phosphodiesterase family protein [Actinomycetota bacterium]
MSQLTYYQPERRLPTSLSPECACLHHFAHRSDAVGHDAIHAEVKQGPLPIVTPSFVDGAHAAGLQVHVWTIDDPAMMNHLLDLGVDGIMTDRVTTLREVMHTRALWR